MSARPHALNIRARRPRSRLVRLPLLAAAATALALTSACSSGTTAASPGGDAAGKPVQGGSIVFAVDTEPVSFDIHASPQDITGAIQRNVFDSLVSQSADGSFHPWLATSWEVSSDYKTYTFHLRHDVTFTDGTKFDADAVKANFDHIVAPSTKSQYAASLLGPYTGTQVVDPYTVKVSFSQSFAPFLQAASTPYLGFYSPAAIKKYGAGLAAGGPDDVGTGPYVFAGYTKGQSAVLTRNPNYHWGPATAAHQGAAYLNQITVRFLPEDSVRVGALTSGQIQVAAAVPPVQVQQVTANPQLKAYAGKAPGAVYSLVLNTTVAPLDDQRVREAIQRGIDLDTDVKSVYFGVNQRAWSPLSPSTPDYDASLEGAWKFDPALANQLLDQAGWTGRDSAGYRTKNGKRLTVEWPLMPQQYIREQRDVLGQAIQGDLKKIGVEITRPRLDIGTYIAKVYGGKEGIADYSWARFDPDVLRLYFNSASEPAKGGQNATFYKDAQLDQWTDQGEATLDPATRSSVYQQTQRRATVDLSLIVPVYVDNVTIGATSKLHGFHLDPNTWADFYDAWLGN
ncbi:ABC transporter substrate-binding protein [Streptacidiphilus jiangxiensis]|uniref:Peptide/nickel transport system substrate-binding protein n=1 Tax=Streptacidiphilus jiangxiensis TaxID=235985 RepID=A0A1H7TC93_STRJI|nr:ABC transporter substrate-binding protein [Streptacidiphilus jiangxiensis]SEL82482.1 peptide/nickel transport system substrate-binding protein [Streptacidiphilus jiangxiensis]